MGKHKPSVISFLLLLGLVAGFASPSRAQAAAPGPEQGVHYWESVYGAAILPGRCYAVGSKALLLVSTDNCHTWDRRKLREQPGSNMFQDLDLYDIRFAPDGKTVWIAGEEGLVLRSDDGGQTWNRQDSGVTDALFKIAAIDSNKAVISGSRGTLLWTTDGGQHWQHSKYKDLSFFDVAFADADNGWAVGEFETVVHTADGGKTWQVQHEGQIGDFRTGPYFAVAFESPQHGWIVGLSGALLETNDGGKTWQSHELPGSRPIYVATLLKEGDSSLWLGGRGGTLIRWAAGETSRVTSPTANDIAFAGNLGVAVGLDGTILCTEHNGKQWQPVTSR
jgi:photosystem II stability/assembly factor-like uncharacterized protein